MKRKLLIIMLCLALLLAVTSCSEKGLTAKSLPLPSSTMSILPQSTPSGTVTHTLAVNVVGGGTVTKNPEKATYDSWSGVKLTAHPAKGYTFTGWGGNLSGTKNPATIIMSDNMTVTATFQIIPVVSTGSASASPNAVTLNGNLRNFGSASNAHVEFEWGLGTDYGNITPSQLQSTTGAFTTSITGIAAGTTYHFRAIAVGNGTGYGADATFTTPASPADPNGWWNSSWASCVTVNITGIGTALTNYQVELSVPYSSNMQPDFGDIRFVSTDNATVFSYWMTSVVPSTSAVFWVNVPYIAANGTTTIYMYYGNSSAGTTSNIHTTFIFGDDFNDPTYTAAHINIANLGSSSEFVVAADGTAQFEMSGDNTNTTNGNRAEPIAEIYINGSLMHFPGNYIAEAEVESFLPYGHLFFNGRYLNVNWKYEQMLDFQFNQVVENKVIDDNWTILGRAPLGYKTKVNTWYALKAVMLTAGPMNELQTYVNGVQYISDVTDSDLSYPTYNGLAFLAFSVDSPFHAAFRDVRVRQYAAVEPSAALGSITRWHPTSQ